ncbi:hypothetical protein Cgig2_033284 [Carnegiea gigantea]|uniref:RNase H type-1 domain-containing protein n=1 Tax=Carnegiea gigantea TaxID=171969 RepID=A0A9Q1QRY0_9CARY|nr:hypothetical protein Cgig2_033284 [Carnegiea gigantea]
MESSVVAHVQQPNAGGGPCRQPTNLTTNHHSNGLMKNRSLEKVPPDKSIDLSRGGRGGSQQLNHDGPSQMRVVGDGEGAHPSTHNATRGSEPSRVNEVSSKIGCGRLFRVDPRGYQGGVWVLWIDNQLKLHLIEAHNQFIIVEVNISGNKSWLFTAIYANPHPAARDELWQKLERIAMIMHRPWLLVSLGGNMTCNARHYAIVQQCRLLIELPNWEVRVTHVFREANQVANAMANIGLGLDGEFMFSTEPPREVLTLLYADRGGVKSSGFIVD